MTNDIPDTMHAVVLTGHGGLDKLEFHRDWPVPVPGPDEVLIHGHCHQKSLTGLASTRALLSLIPECTVTVLDSGCCGMAGSFGYEAEHFEISKRISEIGPLPYIRDTDKNEVIVANGTSCRHQFDDLVGRKTIHIAQVIDMALTNQRA